MTRKHFKELVQILVDNNADDALIQDIARFCKRQNGEFSMDTWWNYVRDLRFKKYPINELL